jgi:hypothetical protein
LVAEEVEVQLRALERPEQKIRSVEVAVSAPQKILLVMSTKWMRPAIPRSS